jgi:hypothetical protein
MQIYMNNPNIIYMMFLKLNIRYEDYMTLILHKASSKHSKNSYLNKLFAFFNHFAHLTVQKIVEIYIYTQNIVYYMFVYFNI